MVRLSISTLFLPTPSARRATVTLRRIYCLKKEISTHALREEGDGAVVDVLAKVGISTHALREEGDFLCPVTE